MARDTPQLARSCKLEILSYLGIPKPLSERSFRLSPKVSVIVPCFNAANYLRRCISSLVSQTHSNLEIILIDDGSTDETPAICQEFADSDRRVLVIRQKNGGVSVARNTGIDHATGDFLTFVDADDWLAESAIARMLQLFSTTSSNIVACAAERVESDNGIRLEQSDGGYLILDQEASIWQLIRPEFGSMVAPWGKLIPADFLGGLRFPEGRSYEDEFFTYQLLLKSSRMALIPEPLYFYRQHTQSAMAQNFNLTRKLDAIAGRSNRAEALRQHGYNAAADVSYGQILGTFMEVVAHRWRAHGSDPSRQSVRDMSRTLRSPQQPRKFKLFYDLVWISPTVASAVYRRLSGKSVNRSAMSAARRRNLM
ncbi:glycosyltransferase family 2 protein [Ammonicoccus fulvus]|uniref:Glycosyltransferase family 2 protein n=1 Tax=Ammonicoccus fulvus TaxID=3138240 RepID=A0ABZ3FN06_9ACTN